MKLDSGNSCIVDAGDASNPRASATDGLAAGRSPSGSSVAPVRGIPVVAT
jgi:hypothetical protein